jgi:two-component system OmpR family response regulator
MIERAQTAVSTPQVARSVLLVEDDAAVCYFLERILRRAGYTVGMAADGEMGLQMFRSRAWDLVITDRMMPNQTGEQMAEVIKQESPSTRIILITGFPQCVERAELFDAVFSKPFVIADLMARVTRLLPT